MVELAKRYYQDDDATVLPRNIATREAFENAMALDIAMGGSTNTILHLLAAAQEAELEYDLTDIDAISRRVPCLAKVAPNVAPGGTYYMEDVHRAGGIPALLGELYRGGLLNENVHTVHSDTIDEWLKNWDIRGGSASPEALDLWYAAPGCRRSAQAFSQSERWDSLDTDASGGCIRSVEHAYSADGGLAVLRGNIALDGCVVKTAWLSTSRSGPSRARPSSASRRTTRSTRSSARRSPTATWSSSATRAPRAAPACRRCSTRPPS